MKHCDFTHYPQKGHSKTDHLKVVVRQYCKTLSRERWSSNQITLTLQDEDGLVNRNLTMRWGQIGLTVKSGIVRLAFLEDVVDGSQQHSGNRKNGFLMSPALL